jgi:hypothetical protein
MKTSKALKKAKALLLKNGWTQGAWRNHADQFCSWGACRVAVFGATKPIGSLRAMDNVFNRSVEGLTDLTPNGNVVIHNDFPATTFEDIMLMFDFAIGVAEAEEEEAK